MNENMTIRLTPGSTLGGNDVFKDVVTFFLRLEYDESSFFQLAGINIIKIVCLRH